MWISPDSNRELLQSGFSFLLPFVRMLSVNSILPDSWCYSCIFTTETKRLPISPLIRLPLQ